MTTFTLNFNPIIELTDEQFYQLCRANPAVIHPSAADKAQAF